MKKIRKMLSLMLCLCMAIPTTLPALAEPQEAVETVADETQPVSLDEIDVPALDNSVANQLPMTGYFTKSVIEGRSMKVYLAEGIHVRDYYTIIAVPDGVDTEDFLTEKGWFDVADQKSEGLIILEPGAEGWGSAADEAEYINAAIKFYSGNGYFSVFGENYLVGYGAGAPALEYWAAANPLKVIAQVYVDSEGLDAEYLTATGAIEFSTKNGAYNNVELPADFQKLTNSDAVAPTMYVGNAPEESLNYWKSVNDVEETAKADAVYGDVYAQKADSDNWTTDYSGPISKVAVAQSADTAAICSFMYYYTRYENSFVYGNQLSERASFENAEFYTVEVNGHPREYYVYTPDNMMENTPVVMVWPGNTQTDRVFADATQWHQVADAEGFMLVMMCEDYNTSTAVTHKDSEAFNEAAIAKIKADYAGKIDETRIYGSGQSLGSMTTQGWVSTHPEYYAAVASTSGPTMENLQKFNGNDAAAEALYAQRSYLTMPTYLIYGMGDLTMLEGDLWDGKETAVDMWADYVLAANGLDKAAVGAEDYTLKALDQFGHKNLHIWTWNKTVDGVDVPLVQLAENMVRSHNCISAEMPELWNYMKHYSMELDENGVVAKRYYSESAFEKDDAVVIYEAPTAEELQAKVVDIKATVAPNFYGHKVSQVVITFAEDVAAYELKNADINVWDRGSANPNFGTLKVVDKKVEGNVVTLTFNTDSDKTGDRSRNSFGMMNTTGWYMDSEGNIYYGSEDSVDNLGNKIYANQNSKTCQPRTPELILTVDSDLKDGIMADDARWEELELTGGLEKVVTEFVNVGKFAEGYSQVSENGEVPVQVIYPEGYDKNSAEKYPVVVYQCGGGVNYWQLDAGTKNNIAPANNLGCNTVYDNTMTQWAKAIPNAIVMGVNVQSSPTETSAWQITAVLDYAIANWNADPDKIVMSGNSQGTIIGSDAIRQRPDLFAAFIECNGNFGAMISTPDALDGTVENSSFKNWTAEEVARMIDNDVACWMFNGETDGANPAVAQDTYEVLAKLYAEKGYSAEWIFNNIHVSGLQSWKFKAYGETDHSVTKVVADQYVMAPYTDVYENANMKPGQKYKFTGKESYAYYDYTMDFDYTVYEESVSEWVLNLFAGKYDEEIKAPVKAEQTVVINKTAITKVYGDKAFKLGAKTTGDGKLTYKSDNTKVAKVDKKGKVTIVGTGKAVITITAAETETSKAAVAKVTIKVLPKKGAIASAKVTKKNLAVTVKKDAKASGYQVQVSTSINFTKKTTKTVTLTKKTKVTATLKNLKAGSYYVRTRSYKTVGSKKYYGAYSAVKNVKVK